MKDSLLSFASGVIILALGWGSFQIFTLNREMGEVRTSQKHMLEVLTKIDKRLDKMDEQNERIEWVLFNSTGKDVRGDY